MGPDLDAVVAGHICLDITPEIHSEADSLAELLRPGALVTVGQATVSTGGPVSNTGFPLRRLGMRVALMGKVGDDAFGRAILERIGAEAPGAEAGMSVADGEHSSYTVVISPPGIDRIFLHCTGANDTFGPEDIDAETVARARLMHFGYPPLMARTYADNGAALCEILGTARDAGATTSLDLAWPDPAGPAAAADWPAILDAALPDVDLFTPSVEELAFMVDRPAYERLRAGADGDDLLAAVDADLLAGLADRCLAAGAAVVMIKCGYRGIYVRAAGADRLDRMGRARCGDPAAWAGMELFQPSYAVDRIVSATGAGDCAIAGFLAAFLRGLDLADALRTACAVGAQNLQAPDAISGVRTWDATAAWLATRPPVNAGGITLPGAGDDGA